MNRTLVAAAFAAVLLPAAAGNAAAAPAATLGKTYTLGCSLNQMDGTALKVRMMVRTPAAESSRRARASR